MMDSRHQKRVKIVQELYAHSFAPDKDRSLNQYQEKTIAIINKQNDINGYIKKYALKFPIEKIAKVDLAILQLSIYDLIFEKKEPAKVVIDEAVELARELGAGRSYAFVNAILGKVFKEEHDQ